MKDTHSARVLQDKMTRYLEEYKRYKEDDECNVEVVALRVYTQVLLDALNSGIPIITRSKNVKNNSKNRGGRMCKSHF